MKTAKEIFDESMDRAKNMRKFEVIRYVDSGWLPNGYIPFDIRVKENTATMTVYAMTAEEADQLVTNFMEEQ